MEENITKEEIEKELNQYIENLEKTKKPKLEACDDFKNLWTKYVSLDGFSTTAETFLYKGFKYSSVESFVKYLQQQQNNIEIFQTFLNHQSKREAPNCFKMNCSLLSTFLNTSIKRELIAKLIYYFPKSAYNKEKKLLGNGSKLFTEYFLENLYDTTEFQPLINYETSTMSCHEFENFVKTIVPELNKKKDPILDRKIQKLAEWITPYMDDVRAKESEKAKKNEEVKKQAEIEAKKIELEKAQQPKTVEEVSVNVDKLSKEVSELKILIKDKENKNEDLLLKNEKINELLTESENRNTTLNNKLSTANSQIVSLENEIKNLHTKNTELELQINKLKNEIDESHNMNSVITSVQEKKIDTTLNKISSQIKVEYDEFKEAENMEMSSALGEVLKELLKNLFDKLSKAGIKME